MVVACSSGFVQPRLIVRLAWGSRLMSKTSLPFRARPMPRFSVVQVLPTPPFWLAMAIVVDMAFLLVLMDLQCAEIDREWDSPPFRKIEKALIRG